MKKFNWKYFVDTDLKIKWVNIDFGEFKVLNFSFIDTTKNDYELYVSGGLPVCIPKNECKPLIKDPKSLSDEELMFIFLGEEERERGYFIVRDEDTIYLKFGPSSSYCSIQNYMNLKNGVFKYASIETFERMYKYHTLPQYMILLKAGVILDAGNVYDKKEKG